MKHYFYTCMRLMKYIIGCNDGEIRLVGGSTNLEGTVEICFGNLWGLIAESGWGDHDAAATCRQLRFLGEGKYIIVIVVLVMIAPQQALYHTETHILVNLTRLFMPVVSLVLVMSRH